MSTAISLRCPRAQVSWLGDLELRSVGGLRLRPVRIFPFEIKLLPRLFDRFRVAAPVFGHEFVAPLAPSSVLGLELGIVAKVVNSGLGDFDGLSRYGENTAERLARLE